MRGALFMMGAMTAFTVNDAFMKAVASELPVMQAIFWRSIIVVPLLALLCWGLGQFRFDFPARDWGLMIIRAFAEMFAAVLFISALFNMPFANVSAILQALPLTVSLGAAVFFSEPLGWRRITAIVVGFAGVLLIVQPGGADFTVYSLYAVGCVLAATTRDLAARRMSAQVPSTFAGLVAAVSVLLMSGVGFGLADPVPMTPAILGYLACAALFIVGAYVFSVSAMRVGEIGFVAPFRYTSLLVAMLLGALIFGEVPGVLTLLGAGIVVAMGLFTLYRERVLRLRQTAAPGVRNAPGV
jgi:S-adenosylmethionine uptake transporter